MSETFFLSTALGEPQSGRTRYGAAMTMYRSGNLTAEQLECFRIASADDALDPALLLAERGLPPLSLPIPSAEAHARTLVDEVDAYFSRLTGPGIAEVRRGISAFRQAPYSEPARSSNPVVAKHLPSALAEASKTEPALTALISAVAPRLNWITYDLYDLAAIGESFARSHAYCTIIGEAGAIRSRDFDLGLFLIAPNVLYRDHRHLAPELYVPLTGPHGWRFKPGAPLVTKQAHEPVWNEPNRPHLTKVGQKPFLCLYCWTRDNDKPAEVLPALDWPELEKLVIPDTA